MKLRMKMLSIGMAAIFGISASVVPVFASTGAEPTAGAAEAARNIYEGSVVSQMAGRCGAASPSGAKGIAFEIMDKDLTNLKDLLKQGRSTALVKNPHATAVDLVTTENGKIVGRIQCKDAVSDSGVRNVLKSVKEGHYNSATLHGTKEAAEVYNTRAAADGVSKHMTDTGISDTTTQRIANKSLGNVSRIDTVAPVIGKAALLGCLVNGTIATVQCIKDGKNIYDSVGHIAASAGTGAASYSASAAAAETATAALAAAGAPTLTVVLVPAGCAIGTAIVISVVLNYVSDDAENFISKITKSTSKAVTAKLKEAQQFVSDLDLKQKTSDTIDKAISVPASIKTAITSVASKLKKDRK